MTTMQPSSYRVAAWVNALCLRVQVCEGKQLYTLIEKMLPGHLLSRLRFIFQIFYFT